MTEWTTACPDWERKIVARQSLQPGAPLFPAEAEEALRLFRELRVVDVAGQPTMGQIARPWILDFVASIFGAYDHETGRRLINEFFLLISKKNSKSTTAAGIMITALLMNWRQSAEFIILAPTLEIANNSAKPALDMVNADPELKEILRPIPHQRTIEHRNTGATLKIVAADTEVVGGKKAAGVLIDELWLFGKMAHADDILREATGGLASRPEGFVIALTTQSNEPPVGVFKEWLDRFRGIRDGTINAPRSLGLLYEFPPAMLKAKAYEKPENFYVTNPNLGASVDEEFLLDEWEKAKQKGARSLSGFFSKHLNIEIGMSLHGDRWSGAEFWERQTDPALTKEELLRRSEAVVVGIDGGGLDDLFGLNLLGRCRETKHWLSWSHAWCHDGVLKRRQSIETVLRGFEKAGELTIVSDELDDVSQIIEVIEEVQQAGLLAAVAVDPAGLGEFVDALAAINITQEAKTLIGVPQGFRMMAALKTAERKLASATLWHSPSGLMAWAVGNLKIEPLATAIRATKQNAGDAKIDPAMALFDSVTIMSLNPIAQQSVFDQLSDDDGTQTSEEEAQLAAQDAEILRNPMHPGFEAARERFELSLPSARED